MQHMLQPLLLFLSYRQLGLQNRVFFRETTNLFLHGLCNLFGRMGKKLRNFIDLGIDGALLQPGMERPCKTKRGVPGDVMPALTRSLMRGPAFIILSG